MGLTEVEASAATKASGTTSKSFASKAKSTESKEWANELTHRPPRFDAPTPLRLFAHDERQLHHDGVGAVDALMMLELS